MDITTSVGLIAGTIVVVVMVLMGGDLHMFISEHAMIIIFGGSISATLIRFPLVSILHGLPLGAKFAFTMSRSTARGLVDELAGIAEVARKQGPVGLEKVETPDPFLAKGIRYVADGYDMDFIRDNLERDRDNFLMHLDEGSKIYQCIKAVLLASMNGYAPQVAIEFGRKVLYSGDRPSFIELEEDIKARKGK